MDVEGQVQLAEADPRGHVVLRLSWK